MELRFQDRALELANSDKLRSMQFLRLRRLLESVWSRNDFYREHWGKFGLHDLDRIESIEDFAQLVPTISKSDFVDDQRLEPPYGRRQRTALELGVPLVVSTTSGTSGQGQEVHLQTADEWVKTGQIYSYGYRWSGLSRGDSLALALPLTMLGGGRMECQGAEYYGLSVLPIGNYKAQQKLDVMRRFGPTGIIGMTSYLGRLGAQIEQMGDFQSPKVVMAGGEGASYDWLSRLQTSWRAKVFDRYGSSQAGNDHMFTCEQGIGPEGRPGMLHNIDTEVLLEVIDPDTGKTVADGESGEIVITTLFRTDTPVIRCRTGDRGIFRPGSYCPCGRGFSGIQVSSIERIDDMKKVKGINIWPLAVEKSILEFTEVVEYQVVLTSGAGGEDVASIEIRLAHAHYSDANAGIEKRIADKLRQQIGIGFIVKISTEPGVEEEWKARRWTDFREHVSNSNKHESLQVESRIQ